MVSFNKLLNRVGWPSPIELLKAKSRKTKESVPQNPKLSPFKNLVIFLTREILAVFLITELSILLMSVLIRVYRTFALEL